MNTAAITKIFDKYDISITVTEALLIERQVKNMDISIRTNVVHALAQDLAVENIKRQLALLETVNHTIANGNNG